VTIRRPATAISDAPAGEGTEELASVVGWYTLMVELLVSARSGCEQSQQTNSLFDYLVGAREQRRRDFEAERLRGLQIDHPAPTRPIRAALYPAPAMPLRSRVLPAGFIAHIRRPAAFR
jgi:hypothetical protein